MGVLKSMGSQVLGIRFFLLLALALCGYREVAAVSYPEGTPERSAAVQNADMPPLESAATEGVLTIAGSRNLPPFSMLAEHGEPVGVGVDLWRLWSRKTGWPIQFRLTDIQRAMADLQDGRADIHAGLFHSQQRSERLSFSAPYLRAPATLYYLFRDGRPRTLEDFRSARIGVQGPPPVELFQGALTRARPIGFENIPQMMAAVERGDIDAFLVDRPSAERVLIDSGLRGEFKALDEEWPATGLIAARSPICASPASSAAPVHCPWPAVTIGRNWPGSCKRAWIPSAGKSGGASATIGFR